MKSKASLRGKRILITSGSTCVSIDEMRVISNRATGELGQKLALNLSKAGAKVTLLEGAVLNPLQSNTIQVKKFYFFDELKDLLKIELKKNYAVVLHNAAVSDYRLQTPFKGKLSSSSKTLTLKLIPTEKLINTIKKISPKICLVGFKLEDFKNTKEILAESKKLIAQTGCDLVIANTLKGGYSATIVNKNLKILDHARSRAELTLKLTNILKQSN